MSTPEYTAEVEVLKFMDGTPYAVITRVFATTTVREIAAGVTRDVTETREVAEFHNRITPDTPAAPSPGQPQQKENA